ncbi:SMODS domain-containing nucleotidyltransferase [Sorangium sp. So ce1389]|uniref:SMODS domain-containing nucleotidyltransferase n=1 Tax=Sorangium sp. So ce1389 TaxID=3133336 RepID=UPI003F5D8394
MNLPSYFDRLLENIEPSPSYKQNMRKGHKTLRDRLASDKEFSKYHVNTFLQGSYKRSTAIHPGKDVDIVVVTSFDPKASAAEANAILGDCLSRYYKNVTPQSRSFGITLEYVCMDVVLATSTEFIVKLAEARTTNELEDTDAWLDSPLLIPDRDLQRWVKTDPKRQLQWTTDLNKRCGGHFVPLVKMFKWWRKEAYTEPKYPKGYILERLAGECVDMSKRDHAEGFVQLLENIVERYRWDAAFGQVPHLPDPGVPSHNVAGRLAPADFKRFISKVEEVLPTARAALVEPDKGKSVKFWQSLFGDRVFPNAPELKAAFPAAPVRPNKPAGFA